MSEQRSGGNQGSIFIGGSVTGDTFAIGQENKVTVVRPQVVAGAPAVDGDALKQALMDLHKSLGVQPMADEARMKAQVAVGTAHEAASQKDAKPEDTVAQIKKVGDTLQAAGTTVTQGSSLAAAVIKLAGIVGPIVVGGARVVAAWFGIHLP